jgi:thiamine pyrophosphokinase
MDIHAAFHYTIPAGVLKILKRCQKGVRPKPKGQAPLRGINLKGITFIGGEGPDNESLGKIATGADMLVAADSGLVLCEDAGLVPDWILGDMDSLVCEANQVGRDDLARLEKYPPERVLRFPVDKDFTDTELTLNFLSEKGCDEIWIVGGGGGRLDHLFAVRSIFDRDTPPDRWFPGKEEIRCLKEGRVLGAMLTPGSTVSVFPLGSGPWEAKSSGLKWPLDGLDWERGSAWISNIAVEGPFEIRAVRGRLMIIMPMLFGQNGKEL